MAEQLTIPELQPLLKTLTAAIQRHVRQQALRPGVAEYIQHTVSRDFSYGADGVTANGGLTGRRVNEVDWTYASLILGRELSQTSEFVEAIAAFENNEPGIGSTRASNLISVIVPKILQGEIQNEEQLVVQVNRYISSFTGSATERAAKVELLGLVLEGREIQLPNCSLRQTRREDLEKREYVLSRKPAAIGSPWPGAIAEISRVGHANEIHDDIPKLVTMLRLFDVGSVNFSVYWYRTGTPLVGDYDTHHPGAHVFPSLVYRILVSDEPRLQRFWTTLWSSIPKEFYRPAATRDVSSLKVAYERYCAAILRTDSYEERLANSMMGLEALFMSDNQELMFRCRLRVARVMSHLNENPEEVFDRLRDGYDARNAFAHGDRMSSSKFNAQIKKYGDVEVLFRFVTNLLRKGLVASLSIPDGKTSVIQAIDAALVDPKREASIAALFCPAATIA